MSLGKELKRRTWTRWVLVLSAVLLFGIVTPLDVLDLDGTNVGDDQDDTLILGVIAPVSAIRSSPEGFLPLRFDPAISPSVQMADLVGQRTHLTTITRAHPVIRSWIRPRALVRRVAARTSSSVEDPA